MRTATRYEIEYSAYYGSNVVRDRLTGLVVGRTQTEAGCQLIRRRKEATLFIPELDGETVTPDEQAFKEHAERESMITMFEMDPDEAYERHLESNEQYAYECEQDELRALYGF